MKEHSSFLKPFATRAMRNQSIEIGFYKSNEEMQRRLENTMMSSGLSMMVKDILNRFRPLYKMVMHPP